MNQGRTGLNSRGSVNFASYQFKEEKRNSRTFPREIKSQNARPLRATPIFSMTLSLIILKINLVQPK